MCLYACTLVGKPSDIKRFEQKKSVCFRCRRSFWSFEAKKIDFKAAVAAAHAFARLSKDELLVRVRERTLASPGSRVERARHTSD